MDLTKMNCLYNAVIENDILTEEILKNYSFSLTEIEQLIYKGILGETAGLEYKFLDYVNLCDYAWLLSAEQKYEKARICLEKVLKINPKYLKANYRLFYENVFAKDDKSILNNLLVLYTTHDKDFIIENNVTLYLLSFTMEFPQNFKKYVKLLTCYDLTNTTITNENGHQNEIYEYIFKNNFKYAFKRLNDFNAQGNQQTMSNKLIKVLLIRVIEQLKVREEKLEDFIIQKEYKAALSFLKEQNNLTFKEKVYVKLLELILLLKETNLYLANSGFQTPSLYKAINKGNYILAQQISAKNDKLNENQSIISKLLVELNKLNNKNYFIERNRDFEEIFQALKSKVDSYDLIKEFLLKLNKIEYLDLILNLIKVSQLKNDKNYLNVLLTLNRIEKNEFEFNLDEYIELYESALKNKYLEKARIYLSIILSAKKTYNAEIDLVTLKNLTNDLTSDIHDEYDLSIDDLIRYKYNELISNKGMVLLKALDPITTEVIIRKIQKDYEDVAVISIGFKETRQLVFIHKPKLRTVDNPKELIILADSLYYNGSYEEAKNNYIKLIEFGKPEYFIYAKIGLCYLKLGNKSSALDYLKLANNMIKKEGITGSNYDELIKNLSDEVVNKTSIENVLKLTLKIDATDE